MEVRKAVPSPTTSRPSFDAASRRVLPLAARLTFALAAAALAAAASGCVVIPLGDLLKGPALREQVLVEGAGLFWKEKIAVVDIDGVIRGSEGSSFLFPRENTVAETLAQLELARSDSQVKAVVIRISSPGGEATACDVLHSEIRRFREETKVPVVTCIADVGASGGYYISVAGDVVYAQPTAIVGSVGVILHSFDLSNLLRKIGVAVDPVKAGAMKDLNSPFRPSTEEERKVLQALVDSLYERFVDVVAAGRKELSREDVLKIADGRVVSAQEALSLKLVDKVGYLRDAIREAGELGNVRSPTIVRYTREATSAAKIYTGSELGRGFPDRSFELTVRGALPEAPRLYYLWCPEL